jgi:hypothetical protein
MLNISKKNLPVTYLHLQHMTMTKKEFQVHLIKTPSFCIDYQSYESYFQCFIT